MGKKIVGIFIVGLLIAIIFPLGSSLAQTVKEKQIMSVPHHKLKLK
jgi:hypothetical protein